VGGEEQGAQVGRGGRGGGAGGGACSLKIISFMSISGRGDAQAIILIVFAAPEAVPKGLSPARLSSRGASMGPPGGTQLSNIHLDVLQNPPPGQNHNANGRRRVTISKRGTHATAPTGDL